MKTGLILLLITTFALLSTNDHTNTFPYQDPDTPIQERVEDLLQRMTIEEKIGQMTQLNITVINTTGEQRDVELDEEKARDFIVNHHVGSFLNGEAVPAKQWYEYMSKLTRIAVEESRLGIPIIYGIDHIHGASYLGGSTIFPQGINLGATFNTEHSYNMGWVTALESADLGHHWNFAPVLDLGVNQMWPRFWETYGEDPYMASEMGVAYIEGYQGNEEIYPYKVAATAKHFLAYSDPASGWDRTPVQIGMQHLHEIHRPPFQAAVDAGVKTIMANSGEVNGIPVHASHEFLTELLRDEMGFEGVVVTDWDDIGKLVDFHYTASDYKEATYEAVKAGIDVNMTPLHLGFNEALLELYNEDRISEERIDESVRRILTLKFELGLFENPFPRDDRFDRIGSDENKAKARAAADESIVLLTNENNTLPLRDPSHITLMGMSANSKRNLSGGWTLAWQGGEEEQYPEDMHTVYTALQNEFPNAEIELIEEIPANEDNSDFINSLNQSDMLIYVGGEEPYTEFIGNITDLTLPQGQLDDIRLIAQSDTPLTLILVQGRPRIITNIYQDLDAFIHAGLPGFEGAEAIAGVVSGSVNPSGKLPFSYPQHTGHFLNYNHKSSDVYFFNPDEANHIAQVEANTSLFQFGDGLSYTTFAYSDLKLSNENVKMGEKITASVTVTNTGDIEGMESVLWFLTNHIGSISRPVKELKHFEKVTLQPGESKTLEFEIDPNKSLWYPDRKGQKVLEDGEFTIAIDELSATFHFEQ